MNVALQPLLNRKVGTAPAGCGGLAGEVKTRRDTGRPGRLSRRRPDLASPGIRVSLRLQD